jgi:hypothetical protein
MQQPGWKPEPDAPPPPPPKFGGALPKWRAYMVHNLYLNNARPCAKEVEPTVLPNSGIEFEVPEPDNPGAARIIIRITKPELLATGKAQVVTTETLGKTIHAEQCYEEADGTSYKFDRDFFGNYRKAVIPGPFEVVSPITIELAW